MSGGRVFGGATWHGNAGYNFHVTDITYENKNELTIIKWTDPCDDEWVGTKIIRKANEYPQNSADGTLLVDCTIHNQYAIQGYEDSGFPSGTDYYYKAFPYSNEGISTSYLNQAVPAKYVSYSGAHKDEIVTVVGTKKRLLTITGSGVLTVTGDVQGDVWMCAGGAKGGDGSKGSQGGDGGCGGRSEEIFDFTLVSGAVVIGKANGGATSYAGKSAAGSNTRSGGSGGGMGGNGTTGTGDGKSKTPFGLLKLFPQKHCAGGGGGGYFATSSSSGGGGSGGTDGDRGGSGTTSRGSSGAGGVHGGGAGGASPNDNSTGENGKSATFYGGGGGGGGAGYSPASAAGTGGNGYQGVMYILLPFDVK